MCFPPLISVSGYYIRSRSYLTFYFLNVYKTYLVVYTDYFILNIYLKLFIFSLSSFYLFIILLLLFHH